MMDTALSPRIAALKADVMNRKSSAHGSFVVGANPYLREVALWKAWQRGRSRVQQRAACVLEQVKLAGIDIYPGWTLAGEHLADYGSETICKPDEAMQKRLDEFELSPSDKAEVKDRILRWHGSDGKQDIAQYYAIGDISPENEVGFGQPDWGKGDSGVVFWAGGWTENHSIRDYAKVIRIGYDGIRKEIEKKLAKADISNPDFPRKENFWKAGLMICEAGILLGQRYSDLAMSRAEAQKDPLGKKRFMIMAETCARVPRKGARTLFEAVQALWFAHILTCAEDGINANSLGRLDQILNPYYRADIKPGCVTRKQAVELMEELACKLYLDYDVQAITLGGVDATGADAVNAMSYILLEATKNAELIRDVSVRLHSKVRMLSFTMQRR
jgi:formate C-acetyltransferase